MGPFWHVGPDQDHVPISGPTPNMVEKIRPTLVSLYSVAHTSSNFSLWQCTLGDLSTSTLMRYEIRLVELRKNIIRGNCRKLHNTPSSDHTLPSLTSWMEEAHPLSSMRLSSPCRRFPRTPPPLAALASAEKWCQQPSPKLLLR